MCRRRDSRVHRHAFGNQMGELVGDVVGGSLALDGGIDGEDDFADLAGSAAIDQLADGQIRRANAIERRHHAAQHMIAGRQGRRPLQGPEIGDILDDDDDARIAEGIAADGAGVDRIDIAADAADTDLGDGLFTSDRQRLQQAFLLLDQMQRRPPGRSRPKPRQFCQQLDQPLDLRPRNPFRHLASSRHPIRTALRHGARSDRKDKRIEEGSWHVTRREFRTPPVIPAPSRDPMAEGLARCLCAVPLFHPKPAVSAMDPGLEPG